MAMATAAWYHRDISRVHAEDLLAHAGRDGSYLLRDSESVPGAYALCLLFQRHVHTYRILPDADGLLAVQHPHKGLVTPLLYAVPRDTDTGDESSDDEKPPPGPASVNAVPSTGPPLRAAPHLLLDKMRELNTSSAAGDVIGLLNDYLFSELPLDIENVHKGATTLCHLKRTLGTACHGLNSEIDLTLSSLETLAKVFDHPSCSLTHTKKQVLKALQDAVTNHNLAAQPNPPPPEPTPTNVTPVKNHARQLPVHSFQVKMVRYGRQTVSVDVDTGVLLFDRKAGSFGIERVSHDRILQIVKFQSSPAKVRMVVDSHHNTPREITFESARKRDAFCQLLQMMRTRHSQLREPDVISVFVGTWNMGGSPPPRSLQSWVTCCGLGHTPDDSTAFLPHDIYALGTQENPQGEKEWTEHIKATLRSHTHIDFKQVAVQSLWNMRLAVFVKPEHESRVSHVNTASVKTGLGNTRNQNVVDILRLLSLGDRQLAAFDISLRFAHLFWCGDLNYRLDLDVQEEKIAFPPTYRYERGSRDCYLWQKYKTSGVRVNVPSWCDRILWKSYPETHVLCTAYDTHSSMEKAWIELEGIEAIVKTASKAKFFIEFSSSCLEETRRSSENDSQSCDVPRFLKLGWSLKQLPKLLPIVSDMEYLQDQHLLLSVKSCDGFESYGECCVALRSLTGESEQFETFLSHRGEEVGSIRGRVRVHVPKDRRGTREKTYEWFHFEKDENGPRRGHVSPASTRGPINRSLAAPPKLTPNSYTNPAYFIFEGVSVARRGEEPLPQRRDPPVIWSGSEALQLPKVSGRHGFDRRPCRRSDFTEIEIPAVLPQYTPTNDLHSPHTNSSYQLFPAKTPPPLPPASSTAMPQYQDQTSPPRDKYHGKRTVHDSILPEKNLRNLYMNHSAIIREKARRDQHQLLPERTRPLWTAKVPSAFPYIPTHVTHAQAAVPWMVDQQLPGPTGDNSLTALQMAKSLSEVDFFPTVRRGPYIPNYMPSYRNGPSMHGDRGYSWDKEVSVLQGAPETVRELLSTLGLQKYTLGLSLNGWDDLDYFSGITEEDLRASGVTNPSHRRRILENLPSNWT
ncbi:Phosphatidylinositol 3,4,5-trisphosphate 5-phosphatase 2B [Liparis tanakae]|uniref:phosphatidylinositol-3,4,5-trisphosphate 5-phosphatase n=1 Tax=Liparis tanakae TaxID=230148 RepID=A0A4Z2GB43_9TELE|nr:Phosphatidylinositol 3,4,5-trisphosphate 5-phosphatase 2B [Liparis tanakae]